MSTNTRDYEFDEFDKPGAERSRRRRGEDDELDSDLEEDLLEEDWPSGKKNASEVSDEELNDDLLQSDGEDVDMSSQDVTLNASYSLGTSYNQQDNSQEAEYTDDVLNQDAQGFEEEQAGEEEYQGEEEYAEEYGQDNNAEMNEDQMDYGGDGYQDEVLDIHINEPLDGEFQDDEYQAYDDQPLDELGVQQEAPEEEQGEEEVVGGDEQQEEDNDATAPDPQEFETEMVENETLPEEETKEESDDEDEEDEESGRVRFRSERKEGVVVRLADASKRRNIPETLELSEKAKRDLMEFEEQERQKRQNRYGGRGRGGGRGGRVRGGGPSFGLMDFRGGNRGRMNDQRPPLMGTMGKLPSRMPPPHQLHQQQVQSQQHHPLHPRGPPPFQDHGRPLGQHPLQPLIPPHMTHRSPPLRPQMEPPPRIMNSPPPNFPQHHQDHPPQPKNIHINPHFRGHPTSSVRVPLMPPAQSQPRHAVSPQRFPGPGDFQQHIPGNFGLPQRSAHHIEPFRNQPPQGPPDREPLFMGERSESTRFPGQHMFDHQSSNPLNNNHNLHHQQQQQLPNQGHMGFGPPGPPFNQLGQGPIGLFPREPPRPNLPPHQGHQGMMNLNQGGSPNQPRPFMAPRQHFGQQGNPFPPPVQFGMQGLTHGPPGPQLPHRDPLPPHQPMHQHQHHQRQELLHREQQQQNVSEPRPMMLRGQNLFQQQQGRQMNSRLQSLQHRTMPNRQRMNAPQHISKPMQPRNSNLRELPVAPGNTNMNSSRPAANVRPVPKATQGVRPEQGSQAVPAGGRGRGQDFAKTDLQPAGEGSAVVRKEAQNPNEDEETRQYRLKIEEQKRLREEILKRKEMRRQMQAGVRKKELLDRLSSHTPGQNPAPSQAAPQPAPQQQPQQQQQQQQQPQQEQLQPQQQRQFPQRAPPPSSQPLTGPNPSTLAPPNGGAQSPAPGPNVKTRLQMAKGPAPQQQAPRPGPNPQWKQPQQNQPQPLQQPRNAPVQNKPGAETQANKVPQRNIPLISTVASAPTGPKPGAKRTVMQRTNISLTDGQQTPPKVRVIKLCGAGAKGPAANEGSEQQQGAWSVAPMNQSIQRKVTVTVQQQQAAGRALQANRGAMGHQQQNRVVVSGRGRGRGVGQVGRGRLPSTRQNQRAVGNDRCTVSIEGLSSSTTDMQLKNLLRTIGPIEMFSMFPQQRKAVAKFTNPEHAANFQMSFHRHMIDLSHIDVMLIDG